MSTEAAEGPRFLRLPARRDPAARSCFVPVGTGKACTSQTCRTSSTRAEILRAVGLVPILTRSDYPLCSMSSSGTWAIPTIKETRRGFLPTATLLDTRSMPTFSPTGTRPHYRAPLTSVRVACSVRSKSVHHWHEAWTARLQLRARASRQSPFLQLLTICLDATSSTTARTPGEDYDRAVTQAKSLCCLGAKSSGRTRSASAPSPR